MVGRVPEDSAVFDDDDDSDSDSTASRRDSGSGLSGGSGGSSSGGGGGGGGGSSDDEIQRDSGSGLSGGGGGSSSGGGGGDGSSGGSQRDSGSGLDSDGSDAQTGGSRGEDGIETAGPGRNPTDPINDPSGGTGVRPDDPRARDNPRDPSPDGRAVGTGLNTTGVGAEGGVSDVPDSALPDNAVEGQGVETGDGTEQNVQRVARELEQQAIENNEQVQDPSDVAIVRDDGALVAVPTEQLVADRLEAQAEQAEQTAIANDPRVDDASDIAIEIDDGRFDAQTTDLAEFQFETEQRTKAREQVEAQTGADLRSGAVERAGSSFVVTDQGQKTIAADQIEGVDRDEIKVGADGEPELTNEGRVSAVAAQNKNLSEDDLVVADGEVVREQPVRERFREGVADANPADVAVEGNEGGLPSSFLTGEDAVANRIADPDPDRPIGGQREFPFDVGEAPAATSDIQEQRAEDAPEAAAQIERQLEVDTGADLDTEDIALEFEDGEIVGGLTESGERDVAAARTPLRGVPVVGDVLQQGSRLRVRGQQTVRPASQTFREVTPSQSDIGALVAAGVPLAVAEPTPAGEVGLGAAAAGIGAAAAGAAAVDTVAGDPPEETARTSFDGPVTTTGTGTGEPARAGEIPAPTSSPDEPFPADAPAPTGSPDEPFPDDVGEPQTPSEPFGPEAEAPEEPSEPFGPEQSAPDEASEPFGPEQSPPANPDVGESVGGPAGFDSPVTGGVVGIDAQEGEEETDDDTALADEATVRRRRRAERSEIARQAYEQTIFEQEERFGEVEREGIGERAEESTPLTEITNPDIQAEESQQPFFRSSEEELTPFQRQMIRGRIESEELTDEGQRQRVLDRDDLLAGSVGAGSFESGLSSDSARSSVFEEARGRETTEPGIRERGTEAVGDRPGERASPLTEPRQDQTNRADRTQSPAQRAQPAEATGTFAETTAQFPSQQQLGPATETTSIDVVNQRPFSTPSLPTETITPRFSFDGTSRPPLKLPKPQQSNMELDSFGGEVDDSSELFESGIASAEELQESFEF